MSKRRVANGMESNKKNLFLQIREQWNKVGGTLLFQAVSF